MRRGGQLQSQTSEPLIVVEESSALEAEATYEECQTPSSEEESPTMNPYLLSPWRDARETRKHSLPTPQCSGITASQVRRLSERGDGSSGPGPKQAEFLATLSTAPAPAPGGRRHSVVTISKVPTTLFGRSRRESVAAFPSPGGPGRVLRRDSNTGPPSTEPRGSVHNLQLDIMDDIVQARKVRMKLWNTSNERVCEVQHLEEGGSVQRYTNARRFSDFVGTSLAPIPSGKRRASELPPCPSTSASKLSAGIVCTNTDLISILSSLTSSSTEIDQCEAPPKAPRRPSLHANRSNSFDVSVLQPPPNWFAQRHQPMAAKGPPKVTFAPDVKGPETVIWDKPTGSLVDAELLGNAIEVFLRRGSAEPDTTQVTLPIQATSQKDLSPQPASQSQSKIQAPQITLQPPSPSAQLPQSQTKPNQSKPGPNMTGATPKIPKSKQSSQADQSPQHPQAKTKTILGFQDSFKNKLKGNKAESDSTSSPASERKSSALPLVAPKAAKPKGWFSGKNDDDSTETCDSSLCSTLKDLFVK